MSTDEAASLTAAHSGRGLAPTHTLTAPRPRKSFLAFLREGRPNEEQRKEVEKLIAALDATLKEEEKAKPVTPAPQAVVAVVETPAATPSPKKKTNALWIGIGVGAVVVVGLAVGLGVGLTRSPTYPNANGRVDGN